MQILLVEDVRTERTIYKRWLNDIGCDVIEASNGAEGLELYHTHRPDLVITDIVMPEKEGIQLIIDLRNEFRDVKVIAISGAGVKEPGEFLVLAKHLGALHTFTKPIDKATFCKAVLELFPVADTKAHKL